MVFTSQGHSLSSWALVTMVIAHEACMRRVSAAGIMHRLHWLHVHEGPGSVNPLALGHMMLACRGYCHPMLIWWAHAVHYTVIG